LRSIKGQISTLIVIDEATFKFEDLTMKETESNSLGISILINLEVFGLENGYGRTH
jgi:hypothetical protein